MSFDDSTSESPTLSCACVQLNTDVTQHYHDGTIFDAIFLFKIAIRMVHHENKQLKCHSM